MNTTLWKCLPLEKCIAKIIDFRGKTPKKIGMEWGGGNIKALSANNVKQGYIDFDKECYVGSQALYDAWMTKGDCSKGDIVFTMEAPLGNVALIPDDDKYILSQRVILLKPNDLVDSNYLYHYISSEKFQNELLINATGSTAKGIKQSRLIKINIILPPKKWQINISNILTNIDKKIDLIDKKIALTQKLKCGLIRKLFSEGVGFQDDKYIWKPHDKFEKSSVGIIPNSWGICQISDLVTIKSKKYDPKISSEKYACIELEHISQGTGKILGSANSAELSSIKNHFNKESVLFGKLRPYLKKFAFPNYDGVCSTEIWVMNVIDRETIDPLFIFYLIQHDRFMNEANKSCGTKMPRADWKVVSGLEVPVPPLFEQIKIASILNTVDKKLSLLEEQKSETQLLKKGLMQKLLTGEWRVPLDCDEEEAA
ncbi:restriction endonuclease subunit S [Serratia nevei]|uniref:restriction endonuclease subunit S n=1 Tax=Serratia nevei TaxID=2703794 RepID=UPI003FA7B74D